MSAVKIGIAGVGGRMGRMLVSVIPATESAELVGGIDRDDDPVALLTNCDVVIDFTAPAATAALAVRAATAGTALVIGTTGLSEAELATLEEASRQIPIVIAANFSLGVNLLLGLVEQVARTLGPDFDIEVLEMHHRLKRDAPSGTALSLGHAAAAGRGQPLDSLWVKSRDGDTGPRTDGTIGFATLRGGDVIGEHSVIFAGPGERLELSHKASDRTIFARGAVRAALWVKGRVPGIYGMKDVLGL